MANKSSTRLEICFQLKPTDADTRFIGSYGSLQFENGDVFTKATKWQGVLLHDFLRKAIEEYLSGVQAAMQEQENAETID